MKATQGLPEYERFNRSFSLLIDELNRKRVPSNITHLLFDLLFAYHSSPCVETKSAFMREYSATLSWLKQNNFF